MKYIKKLDIYVLKQYLLLFAGTFFICLFIFLMQFVWLYMSDLVGKGLGFLVLTKFMFYASCNLVPLSLPLALLLASLITFGNLGERLELLAMKAAGISLLRIVRPVLIFVIFVSGASFYFQNVIKPYSTRELSRLLYSMRQKSPELEIPEGIFYNEIPGYNIFVEHKDLDKGMLYGIMIYTQGVDFDDTQIVLADSGRLQTTEDQGHLLLTLYDGERFRNMQNTGGAMDKTTVPYMRESFKKEFDIIAFDNGLNLMDASAFGGDARAKNLNQLAHGIDSLNQEIDSIGRGQYASFQYMFMTKVDTATARATITPDFDSVYAQLTDVQKAQVYRIAGERVRTGVTQTAVLKDYTTQENRQLRMHKLEQQAKFALSLACLIFFFIGAPLGAIIRKGGLGVPVVVSVLIFIFYYIINASGEKMAKGGSIEPFFGQWLSTMVLVPIAVWLTLKANKDSAVFNMEAYQMFFRKILGLPIRRHLARKEVIMTDPDYKRLVSELTTFSEDCEIFARGKSRNRMALEAMSNRLEKMIEELANTRDSRIIASLNTIPVMDPVTYSRPWRRIRTIRDMSIIQKQCLYIKDRCETHMEAEI